MNLDKPEEVYGVIDLADGKPVMETINLTQLESVARAMERVISLDPYSEASYLIDVFHAAAIQACTINTSEANLSCSA